jgi:hypothetical protein
MLLLKLGKFLSILICMAHVGTNKEEIKVPIPCKLVGFHEALEKDFDWICPKNIFDERSEPKSVQKGS